ncbi:hypothetical protein MMC18_002478 [Xylographa bjoerkii]|nr:hypothetical protein [Xylographa bjoerkii]
MCWWTEGTKPKMPCAFAQETGEYCSPANKHLPGRHYHKVDPPVTEGTNDARVAAIKAKISHPIEIPGGSAWGSQSGRAAVASGRTPQEVEADEIQEAKSFLPNIMNLGHYGSGSSGQGRNKGKGKAEEDPSPPASTQESGLKKLGKQLKKKISSRSLKSGKKEG